MKINIDKQDKEKTFNNKKEKFLEIKFDKNYNKFFGIMGASFPSWTSYDVIKHNLNFIFENDLINLAKEGFLEMKENQVSKEIGPDDYEPQFKKDGTPMTEKIFRLKAKGFEFLNNLNSQKTNKRLFLLNEKLLILTILLASIGIMQIIIMFWK